MFDRFRVLREISELDPEKDCHKIAFLSGSYDFPQDVEISLGLAFFRTYAIPSIAKILDATKQFENFGQKRYDDTTLILGEFLENGLDSDSGKRAIDRLNEIHKRYGIKNEDFLYTLTTFIFEPARWNDRFGWRKSSPKEKLANFHLWRQIGERMNIKNLPRTYEEMEKFNRNFEKDRFQKTPEGMRLGAATIRIAVGRLPNLPGVHYLVSQALFSLMDPPLRTSMGFSDPNPVLRFLTIATFKIRAFLLKFLWPPRKKPFYVTKRKSPSYPDGYLIENLGPR
ncbi:DUF2236 domain-containing protein [Leptospira fletcheri]|uniref:DUF2236 domain-containing protein n=1 Tax=Leptospira fletcheri TaxID=2484981 RepID=A0A4R9GDU4_9LEPT|nr:oxygenase MpaB family protein [Leptospira fletcheri]TGK09911.1 DUF2236 domain-containing protein [Leptospira fletcheri]